MKRFTQNQEFHLTDILDQSLRQLSTETDLKNKTNNMEDKLWKKQ